MWVKLMCVSALFSAVWCGSVPQYTGLDKGPGIESLYSQLRKVTPSPLYELPCMKYGGLCLQENECPEGKQVGVKGLCPLQERQGVECCYSVAKSSTTCRANGGECFPLETQCPINLTFSKASDCHSDEKCCILVN